MTLFFSRDDAVYDELKKTEGETVALPLDEDLPGMGQYYCLHCEYVIEFYLISYHDYFVIRVLYCVLSLKSCFLFQSVFCERDS